MNTNIVHCLPSLIYTFLHIFIKITVTAEFPAVWPVDINRNPYISILLRFLFNNIVKLLALALTNLVLDLATLVTNLAKPSLG